jgi:hypothetical protein
MTGYITNVRNTSRICVVNHANYGYGVHAYRCFVRTWPVKVIDLMISVMVKQLVKLNPDQIKQFAAERAKISIERRKDDANFLWGCFECERCEERSTSPSPMLYHCALFS